MCVCGVGVGVTTQPEELYQKVAMLERLTTTPLENFHSCSHSPNEEVDAGEFVFEQIHVAVSALCLGKRTQAATLLCREQITCVS